ncbi:MAG: glycosyltransferase family 4 protein [Anaerolineae bacterium]|nr:glycosyltransferase family 4 protein [Anaerolineae bacterium]MCA9892669.1 glycosyltransferase family 4 protein [Anaerolineae bacterium]
MQIAIFDYLVKPTNAIGNCDRHLVAGLCDEHDFTVFAVEFDNPRPDRIEFVRIPVIRRPLFAVFVSYHIVAPILLWIYKRQSGKKFDIVQSIESNSLMGTLVYSHFCHTAYLTHHWQENKAGGIRGIARWIDYKFHSLLEPIVYRKAKAVVTPSQGLSNELKREMSPIVQDKVTVIPNPVDLEKMQQPGDFDKSLERQKWSLEDDDFALIFVALGDFERKGLPLLLDAITQIQSPKLKLLIVGGNESTLTDYRQQVRAKGIEANVIFTGMQTDVRPFLWMADLFVFPSAYETFSMVAYEAAAAGLPLLVSPLYGVEDILKDGINGWCIERSASAYAKKLQTCLNEPDQLKPMGENARQSARRCDARHFVEHWRQYYETL